MNQLDRRSFLRRSSLLAMSPLGSQFVTRAPLPGPGVIDIGGRKECFLDGMLIHETSRLSKLMARPEKHTDNPILIPDRPWESARVEGAQSGGVQISGQAVLYDREEGLFKIWYNPWGNDGRPWCYATSRDGIRWEKPELGVHEFQGSRRNNILGVFRGVKYFNVIKDSRDPDPRRRYKAMGESEGPTPDTSGTAVAFSPDGIHWSEHPGNPVVRKGRDIADCPTMLGWDARRQKYVYYPRPGHPLAPEIQALGLDPPHDRINPNAAHYRSIGYSESDDFIHWSPTRLMLAPDAEDRVDFQYYQMTVSQDGEFYVGLLHMMESHEKTFDIFLLTSRDGFRWNWVDRNLPFLGRGEIGSYDAGYLTPSGPIVHEGRVWIYYGAYSGAHSYELSKLGPNNWTIALATLPADRYLGLLAGPDLGSMITQPLLFSGSRLKVDMDASHPDQKPETGRGTYDAELRAALMDESGGPIEGFGLEQSRILKESGVQELSWTGSKLARLEGRPVRLRFQLRNAALYSIQFSE